MGKDLSLIGILVALVAAVGLWQGDIFGEHTLPISILIGVLGVIFIALPHESYERKK